MLFLKEVGFDCQTPLGAFCQIEGDQVRFYAMIANESLSNYNFKNEQYTLKEAEEKLKYLGKRFKKWQQENQS